MICRRCAADADWQKNKGGDFPISGHEACKGCDCQHKPVKAGQISAD